MSETTTNSTITEAERQAALAALDDLVEVPETAERYEVREYTPSPWLHDLEAFDVVQHTLGEAIKQVDASHVTKEKIDEIAERLGGQLDSPTISDAQRAELTDMLNTLYAARGRVGLADGESLQRYSRVAAEYFAHAQGFVVPGAENSAASDPEVARAEFQSVIEQMRNDARVCALFAKLHPRTDA